MSNCSQHCGWQHARIPCSSLPPQSLLKLNVLWVDDASNHFILSYTILLLPAIFPRFRAFLNELALYISGQSIEASSSSQSFLPMNIEHWFPLESTDLILQSKGLSRFFSSTTVESISSLVLSLLYAPTLTSLHGYWKTIALTVWTIVSKVVSLLFNKMSRFAIVFLSRNKCLLISWLHPQLFWSLRK